MVGVLIVVAVAALGVYVFSNQANLKESSSLQIKEIVANETSCCFNGNGCGNGAGDYCVAKSLYDWVINNINYTIQRGYSSADETLKMKSGDCADLSILYCSLLRQAMIDCYYIRTGNHMFNYIIINKSETYESVYAVDIANQKFESIYP